MLLRRYRLSPRARLIETSGARWLVCAHPLQWVHLNESAWELLLRLDGRAWLHDLAEGEMGALAVYLDGLAERGLLSAEYRAEPADDPPMVQVIVPAYGSPESLARCLHSLHRQDYPRERFTVTVVDDGSEPPLAPVAEAAGARCVRLARNQGPADARNAGVAAIAGDADSDAVLAFIDSDCIAEPDWLTSGAAVLEDAGFAALGGSVSGMRADTLLARFENVHSSLHMGDRAARVGLPGAPVPYLPSCNLLVRRAAFRRAGGFQPGWRTGEDVDFSWRLVAGGERLFYWPGLRVKHDHRVEPGSFFARRRDYARSEGRLARKHPERFARNRESKAFLIALGLAAVALHMRGVAALAVLATAIALMLAPDVFRWLRAWRRSPAGIVDARGWIAALLRTIGARAMFESRVLVRQWLIGWLPAVIVLPRAAPLILAVIALAGLGERASRPASSRELRLREFVIGWLWECLAYSLGRCEGWLLAGRGAVRSERSAGANHFR